MNKNMEELEAEAHRLAAVAWRIRERRLELEKVVIRLLEDEFEVQNQHDDLVEKIYEIKWEKVGT